MTALTDRLRQVASEARPPAVWGRTGFDGWDDEFLLWDLVETRACLDRDLKEWFLSLWVNRGDYDAPDLDDPMIERLHTALVNFAAMDPVVNLDSLRGRDTRAT